MIPWERAGLTLSAYLSLPLGARISVCALSYLGWRYSFDKPAVAFPSGSVPYAMVAASRGTNCSTFTASMLMAVYPEALWTPREYADLQVFADRFKLGDDYHPKGDSPIAAVERVGIGHRVGDFMLGSWHLCQGWRGPRPPHGGGHAFLVYAEEYRVQVLAASGTQTGGIGPEFVWMRHEDLRAKYHSMHIARLDD